jgi:hypothetical protein
MKIAVNAMDLIIINVVIVRQVMFYMRNNAGLYARALIVQEMPYLCIVKMDLVSIVTVLVLNVSVLMMINA